MRWPFSRRGNDSAAPGRAADPQRAPETRSPEPPAAGPVQRADWATLPPIQRAAAEPIELTAESGLFVENLTSRSSIEPALQSLGHDVTIDAPHGIASGIARPVQHRSGGAELQHRLRPVPAPKPAAARAQRAPVAASAPPPAPAPEPLAVARHETGAPHEDEVATSPATEETVAPPAEEAARTPAEQPAAVEAAPAQRAPAGTPPASTPPAPASASPSPVARHETGAPHEDEVATSPAAAETAAEPVQRAADDEEAAATSPAATSPADDGVQRAADDEEAAATSPEQDGVQRAPEQPVAAPTVGTRPVVAAGVFRSSLGAVPATIGLERHDPLPFAAQRAPAEAGAAASSTWSAPAAPGASAPAASAGGSVDVSGVQRAAAQPPGETSAATPPSAPVQRAAETVGPAAAAQRAADAPGAAPAGAAPAPSGVVPAPGSPSSPASPGARAGSPGKVQRAADSPGASPAPASGTAPTVGGRKSGLGAPLQPGSTERGSFTPEGFPAERSFRRTRSSLAAQRSPADAPPPGSGIAPSQPVPIAGEKAPLSAQPPAAPASAQRSPAETPDTPLPLAPAAGVQRAADDAAPPAALDVDVDVQRAPETAPEPKVGMDAFVAHASALAAGRMPESGDPFQGGEAGGDVQRAPADIVVVPPAGRLAPRLDLPHRRRESATRGAASGATAPGAAAQSAGVQRAPVTVPAAPQVLPLVGKRPLHVQRSSEDVPAPIRAGVEQQMSTSLEGVKVHRSPESGTAARQLKARAFTTGGEIHLPAEQGPVDREPARSLVAHELVHVAQQRNLGASLPTEDSDHGRQLEAQAQRMEVATQRSEQTAQRSEHTGQRPETPLVLSRRAEPGAQAATSAALAVARRSMYGGSTGAYTMTATAPQLAPSAPPAPVQPGVSPIHRAVEINEITTNTNVNDHNSNNPSSGGGQGGGGGGGTQSDPLTGLLPHTSQSGSPLESTQLEQVWAYVRSKMTEELFTDRERAGLSIDLF